MEKLEKLILVVIGGLSRADGKVKIKGKTYRTKVYQVSQWKLFRIDLVEIEENE